MTILLTGADGQVGREIQRRALQDDHPIVALNRSGLDITDIDAVRQVVQETQPAMIVNAAAYTAVDNAESNAKECRAVNVNGPENLARAAKECGARLLHVSTDFVFDGEGSTPYKTNDPTNPLSVYGQTKRDGELAVLRTLPDSGVVLRTAWLYSKTGSNVETHAGAR